MKKLTYCFIALCYQLASGQENNVFPIKISQKGFLTADFFSVNMPANQGTVEAPMGLSGIHYNLSNKDLYTGLGMYGSVVGMRDGFFTLGVNAGVITSLSNRLFLDAGVHVGGGGGGGAPDGGGAFVLPHLNLGIRFKKISFTTGYSYINFFDHGAIKSHQFRFGVQVPTTLSYTTIGNSKKEFTVGQLISSGWNQEPKRLSFMLHLNNLSLRGASKDVNQLSLVGKTIRLAGFEYNSYLNKKWFYFAKFDGAYHGNPAGYMNVLLGVGHHFSISKNTNVLAKFGMGAGGGGYVDNHGGVLIYPDISIEQHIVNNTYISVNKGFLMGLNSYFDTTTFGVGFKYYSNTNGILKHSLNLKTKFKGFEVLVKQDAYFNAKRIDTPTQALHQISLQFNYNLYEHIYLAGQTSFANFGNAGAYAEGIVGIGMQSNYFANQRINVFFQALIGGAGGGNISTGEGFIAKPSIGFNYQVNSKMALRTSGGYVKAVKGQLSNPFLSLGLSYRFAFLMSQ